MAARRVLIQFAHPALERSRVNRRLIDHVKALPDVTVNDLYEEYPTLSIDVPREQELLRKHDVIVFQHPFYWYAAPAILKEWQDLVLEHGWAYGDGGHALAGKLTFNAITTGAPKEAYVSGGQGTFSVREFLAAWEQTARLCGMPFLAPFVLHDCLNMGTDEDLSACRDSYRTLLEALTQGRVNVEVATAAEHLNDDEGKLVQGLITASPRRADDEANHHG